MKADPQTAASLIQVLEEFCSAFASRDAIAIMHLFAPDPEVVMITSEESLLRGPDELLGFLEHYVHGTTTYSWIWDRYDVGIARNVGWLLSEGTEIARSGTREQRHPYRMTMVAENRDNRWVLLQVHGSSPHSE
jgi:hypothetical protein